MDLKDWRKATSLLIYKGTAVVFEILEALRRDSMWSWSMHSMVDLLLNEELIDLI
jgi:hypothetical protein